MADVKPPSQVVTPETLLADAVTLSPRILMQAHLWLHWARIAIRQERRCLEARQAGAAAENFAPWLRLETEEAIQAVAASRHCLHNLWRVWRVSLGLAKEKQLKATHLTKDLPPDPKAWNFRIIELIGDRVSAVHHDEVNAPAAPHPFYPTNVSGVAARFTAERATESVDVMLDVLERVTRAPTPQLNAFAQNYGHVLDALKDQRATGVDS